MEFKNWLKENQETVDEGFGRNLVAAGLIGLGALGNSGCSHSPTPENKPFHNWMNSVKRDNQDLKNKAMQIKKQGRTKGTFIQGKLQPENDPKAIQSDKETSDDAKDFL
jgi:hypothetical protein